MHVRRAAQTRVEDVTYGVRELQANLGDALRAVENGTRVIVTRRGRPIAVMSQVDAPIPDESPVRRKLRRMAAEGKVRLGKPGPIRLGPPLPGTGLTAQVLADRR